MSTPFNSEAKLPLSAILKAHDSLNAISPRTLLRWTQRTTRGVLLESVRIGGRTMSSLGAVDRFLAAMNPATPTDGGPRSPHQRQRASAEAAAELEAAGA